MTSDTRRMMDALIDLQVKQLRYRLALEAIAAAEHASKDYPPERLAGVLISIAKEALEGDQPK